MIPWLPGRGPLRARRLLSLAGALLVFAALYAKLDAAPRISGFVIAPPAPAADAPAPRRRHLRPRARYDVYRVSSGATPFAHSVAAVELPDGRLRAFWFGGSREGATDCAIYSALYSRARAAWVDERVALTPAMLGHGLMRWVRKVGNPVALYGADGRLRLYVVSVTFGGWAASGINLLESSDGGSTWSRPRRLVASPFLDLSNLVKGAPLASPRGGVLLPAYHEMAGKFGELLLVDDGGTVRDLVRLSEGREALQPVVVPRSKYEALALMRYAGPPPGRVLALRTDDGGRHWSAPERTELPNPNSALDALRLDDGSVLAAFNDTEEGRNDLSLARTEDEGRSWRVVARVEHSDRPQAEFSYPRFFRDRSGEFNLLYTVDKAEIRHVRFNDAWLKERLK